MKHYAAVSWIKSMLAFTSRLQVSIEEELRMHEITLIQYQILNVLAEVIPDKLELKEVRNTMARQTSDFTRIIDRLITKGLVDRFECPSDRRKVELNISEKGVSLLALINRSLAPIASDLQKQMATVTTGSKT